MTEQNLYNELSYYTLEHAKSDPSFIHQYIVDAWAAEHADEETAKPIRTAFALAGLHLHLEKGYTGKEVQKAHMRLAKRGKAQPIFDLPTSKPAMHVKDVLKAPPGPERDKAIDDWSAAVWTIWEGSHAKVADWVRAELGL